MTLATHVDYKHPRHLRVVDGDRVWCVAPGCDTYRALFRKGLPSYADEKPGGVSEPDWAAVKAVRASLDA
jgi:hypothetical protein